MVATIVGVLAFNDRLAHGATAVVVETVAVLATALGVIVLAGFPVVTETRDLPGGGL